MRNWIACSSFSILFLSLSFLVCIPSVSQSQSLSSDSSHAPTNTYSHPKLALSPQYPVQDTTSNNISAQPPAPKQVLYKSMMLPGWGQVINNQVWKVPIIYGILGGLGYYSVYLTKKYHDYRAAYYNLNPDTPQDFRFGTTPSYISEDANLSQIRSLRNTLRNRRDLVYVGLFVAYGLNIVDAYVFAHMRTFDVSEDLSMRPRIKPGLMAHSSPGITLSVDFITK